MATPLDWILSPVLNGLAAIVVFLNAHLILAPIALIGSSVAIVKYSLILLPDRFPSETHNRIIAGVVIIDSILLAVSYLTGVLSLPFGIEIPTINLSGVHLNQPIIALVLGIAGLGGYVWIALHGQRLPVRTSLSDWIISLPASQKNRTRLAALGLISALAVASISLYVLVLARTISFPQVSFTWDPYTIFLLAPLVYLNFAPEAFLLIAFGSLFLAVVLVLDDK